MPGQLKVLLLADASNPHTVRWARSLKSRGVDVSIFTLARYSGHLYPKGDGIDVRWTGKTVSPRAQTLSKLHYLTALPALRRMIADVSPDVLHAHYATSYGLLGALSGFRPFAISVWGSDVFEFPKRGIIHRLLLKWVLQRADRILCTSRALAAETRSYTSRDLKIIPFGIDLELFRPREGSAVPKPFAEGSIVVGTIKTLEERYGIDFLIEAFRLVKLRQPNLPIKLLIVGTGTLEASLKQKVLDLGLSKDTVFAGRVPVDEVAGYHNMLSVFVAVSLSESFGVAILEASASGVPVVVSDVGGLPEVVRHRKTGIIVPSRDAIRTADAIEELVLDPGLRLRMGQAGRAWVEERYDWRANVTQMLEVYSAL